MRLRVTPSSAAAFEWESASAQFRVGRGDQCALRFQGEAGATVSWEHAEFLLTGDGQAFVTDLRSSNGTYVDAVRIAAQTRVRVGSSVQLGKAGPRLEVMDLTVPVAAQPAVAAPVAPAKAAPTTFPATVPTNSASVAAPWHLRNLGSIAAGIVIVTLGFFVWQRPSVAPVPPPAVAKSAPVKESQVGGWAPPTISGSNTVGDAHPGKSVAHSPPRPLTPNPAPARREGSSVDSWTEARQRGLAAFRLIVVEDPKTQASWPFAGAVVVGEKNLLTAASVAVELAKFVERGWRVAAMRADQQSKITITELRIHAAYQQESLEKQLYFDLAVLSTAEPLGQPIMLASAAELASLETGRPLVCLALDHAGDPLDRFQQLEPQAYPSKILAVTSLPPQPGGPRLLHLRGSFTDKACGSPIFNNAGHLVAVYCEPAPSSSDAPDALHVNYAKVIEPELIELAIRGSDERVWVRPQPPKASTAPQEISK